MPPASPQDLLNLAQEILDGIEGDTLPAERSLLKASRLARIARDEAAESWIALERDGYNAESARNDSNFFQSKRAFTDQTLDVFDGVPVLAQRSKVLRAQLGQLRLPDVSGDWASVALRETRADIARVSLTVQRYEGVLAAVERRVHQYASTVLHTLEFSQSAEGVFDNARSLIEPLLFAADPELARKLDYAARSLADDDDEAVSAATNSLRRLLIVFANSVFPAQASSRRGPDGQPVLLGEPQYLNRIKAFIDDNCSSESRRRSLKQRVTFLNERTSTGVHADVTRSEAQFILVSVYVLLGEILSLSSPTDDAG